MSVFETGMPRGAALAEQGAVDEAIARIREGVTKWTRLGRTFLLPYGLAFLAQGLVRHGDQAAALAALREGLALADVTGEHFWDAELHRLTGTVLLAENKLDEGGASLQHAIHIAQAQQAKSLELRATASLARLWRDQGQAAASSRTARSGVRVVHGRLRHARSERGQAMSCCTPDNQFRNGLLGFGRSIR